MSFSINKFLRAISRDHLKNYLIECLKIPENILSEIDWNAEKESAYLDSFSDFFKNKNEQYNQLYIDFQKIHCLTVDKFGQTALENAMAFKGSLAMQTAFCHAENLQVATLELFLKNDDLINQAFIFFQTNRLYASNKFHKYKVKDYDCFEVNFSPETKEPFEVEIHKIKGKNPIGQIKIEYMPHIANRKPIEQIIIYREGMPVSVQTIQKNNQITCQNIREAIETILIYDADNAIIDVMGSGGEKEHKKIAHLFKTYLTKCDKNDPLEAIINREIDFQKFSTSPQLEILPQDNIKTVVIEAINFITENGMENCTSFKATRFDNLKTFYEKLQENDFNINLEILKIIGVKIKVFFFATEDMKQHAVSFELTAPNKHTLKASTANHEYILMTLLERWKIFKDA